MEQNTDITSLNEAMSAVERTATPTMAWTKDQRLERIDTTDPELVAVAAEKMAQQSTPNVSADHNKKRPIEVTMAALRGEVQVVKLAGELASIEVERDALLTRLNDSQKRRQEEVADLRAERDSWRARHDALHTELKALRQSTATSLPGKWVRQLFGRDLTD